MVDNKYNSGKIGRKIGFTTIYYFKVLLHAQNEQKYLISDDTEKLRDIDNYAFGLTPKSLSTRLYNRKSDKSRVEKPYTPSSAQENDTIEHIWFLLK